MKTSELTGAALDWAVAKCEGREFFADRVDGAICMRGGWTDYSTDWARGGPIIEREKLLPCYAPDGGPDSNQPWVCDDYAGQVCSGMCWGETPLIAAMRCYVASKLGDDADVPEELTC